MTLHMASQSLKYILLFMQFIIRGDYYLPTLSIMSLLSMHHSIKIAVFFFSFTIHE